MASPARLRLIFAGTPAFAAQHLQALIDSGRHDIVAVYTQPDRPAGRGKKLHASEVKRCAEAAGLPIYQPQNFRDQADRQTLAEHKADLMVVVAYGLILPQAVLDIPRLGCVNVHASLLPRWRGAAPIQRAIEAGDPETGVTIMQMAAGLDTGDMLVKVRCAIGDSDTAADLHDRLAELGGPALLQALEQLATGTATPEVQDDALSNYAAKIDKAEALVDWQQSATDIQRRLRAFIPFPVCYTTLHNAQTGSDDRVKLWAASVVAGNNGAEPGTIISADRSGIRIACGEDSLLVGSLQLPGGRAMTAAELLNARAEQFSPGTRFGAA